MLGEDAQTLSFRGRRSRNKVSVGEPAEGSLSFLHPHRVYCCRSFLGLALLSKGGSALGAPRLGGYLGILCLARARHVCLPRTTPFGASARDLKNHTTLVDGYLGMSNDEERSEMRYVVRIAEFSESSNL